MQILLICFEIVMKIHNITEYRCIIHCRLLCLRGRVFSFRPRDNLKSTSVKKLGEGGGGGGVNVRDIIKSTPFASTSCCITSRGKGKLL